MQTRSLSICTALLKRQLCSSSQFIKAEDRRSAQVTLLELSQKFEAAGVSEPSLSAQLLVGEVLGITNLDLLPKVIEHSHLTANDMKRLETMTNCRLARMPMQYILGYWEFRQIKLKMRPPVFIPRPETEELVGYVLDHLNLLNNIDVIQLLEIGCGSGAISLSLMREHDSSSNALNILAVDQSNCACRLTVENATQLELLFPDAGDSVKEKYTTGIKQIF